MSSGSKDHSKVLLDRVATGDKQALDELILQHRSFVRRIVDARLEPQLRARVDPSDIVQESLASVTRRMDDYFNNSAIPFRIWLRKRVIQKLVDTRRRHYAQKRDVRRESPTGNLSAASIVGPILGEKASEILRQQELLTELEMAIAKLSETDREILLLRYIEGLSNSEVAQVLNMEVSTASQRHGRALRKLAISLKHNEL